MKKCPNCGFNSIPLNRKEKEALFLFLQQKDRYKKVKDFEKKSKEWCAICVKDFIVKISEEMLKKSEWSGEYYLDF